MKFPYKAEYRIAKKKIKKIIEKKRDTCKGNSQEGGIKMKLDELKKLLEEVSDKPIEDAMFETVEGTEEELEMYLSSILEGEELIDEENKKIEDAKKLQYKERKALPNEMFAVIKKVGDRTIRMFPIHDPAHVRNALARLGQDAPQATLKRLGISVESVRAKILRRARQLKMTDLLKRHAKGYEELIDDYETELSSLVKTIEDLKKQIEDSNKKLEEIDKEIVKVKEEAKNQSEQAKQETEKVKKDSEEKIKQLEDAKKEEIEQAINKTKIITERRVSLGEFADGLTDDDLLDNTKYENAQLKLQIAIKEGKKVNKANLEIGTKDKDKNKEIWEAQGRVHKMAYHKNREE